MDVGTKRIGIALSDELGLTAQGYSVLQRVSRKQDIISINDICRQSQVNKIVLGLPLNMNGTFGPKAIEVQEFAAELGKSLRIETECWDERLSTLSAQKVLLQADVSRKKRKKVIDMLAAVTILQGYLDRMNNKPQTSRP